MNIRMRSAQIIGRSHLLMGRNSQDAFAKGKITLDKERILFGIVCDGCGEGKDSEVGAKLAATFIGLQIEELVKANVALTKIPEILHKRTIGFLKMILGGLSFELPQTRIEFIKNNLLFTIIGFIYSDNETLIFALGDGVIIVDDTVWIRDEQNRPNYIGYNLVSRENLIPEASLLPKGFDAVNLKSESFTRLAIATDALLEEPDFIPELWGYEKEIGLQKKVNVWSLVNHKFKDDLTIITLEKFE